MNFIAYKSRSKKSGFTIIELLVAVAITALLVSLMLNIVINVTKGWSRSSGILTSGNQARLVLDQISRDLQSAIIKADGNVWLAATLQQNQSGGGDAGLSGDANWPATGKPSGTASSATDSNGSYYIPASVSGNDPVLTDYRFGQAGAWLRFFSSVPDTNAAGNLAHLSAPRAIAYQIIRLPAVAGSQEFHYELFRSEVSPTDTFTQGYNLFSPVYNTSTTPATITDAGAVRHPDRQQIIANNVVDFGVRIWVRNAAGTALQIAFPVSGAAAGSVGFAATSSTTAVPTPAPASGAVSAATIAYGYPEVVEVFVRVLTDEGVNQLTLMENPPAGYTPSGSWWDVVLANSRVYTRRIEIKSKAF